MGMKGPGAQIRRAVAERATLKKFPWQKKGLSRVERVISFLEFLPITKGRLGGKKLRLLPGQREFIRDVYGVDGVQLGIKSEPRGNGKTGLMTGLTLCHLLGPEAEFRGECLTAAIDREQAGIIFRELEAIILEIPEFAARVNIVRWHKMLEVFGEGEGQGSRYQAMSADARKAHGLAPSFWVYDELAQAKNRVLLDNLMTAMGKRKRTLGIIISTQAASDEHPLSQLIDDAKLGLDKSVVLHLTAAPIEADPFDPKVIRSVNPAFGHFLDAKVILDEAKRAKRMPSFEPGFRNLRLNQRVNADASEEFLTAADWERGNGPIDESLFTDGRPVFAGLDLSARKDLTGFVLLAEDDDGNVHIKPTAWTPRDTLAERTHRDRVAYDAWAMHGLLETTPGPVIDLDWVAERIATLTKDMDLQTIAYDDWGIEHLKAAFDRIGYSPPLMNFKQAYKDYRPAVDAFEKYALEGRFRHGAHPVLKWCVGNTVMKRDPKGNRIPDKSRYYGRVDLAVAAIMAMGAKDARSGIDVEAMIA